MPYDDIFEAIEAGDIAEVREFLNQGVDIDSEDNEDTPLHCAAENGNLEIVSLLLDRGADINAIGYEGLTPLHLAAEKGNLEIVTLLLDRGADVNAENAENDEGLPVLHAAFYGGKIEIINLMLARGANIDVRDADGSTLLGIAVQQRNLEIVSLLIDKGADVNAEDMLGQLVLVFALFEGDIEIFKILVKAGAGLDQFQYEFWLNREPEYIDLYQSTIVAWRACTGQELSENQRSFMQSENYKRDFVQEFLQSKSGQIAYKGAINSIISPDEESFLSSEFYDADFAKAYLEAKAAQIIARLEEYDELTYIEKKFFNSVQFKKLDASKRFEQKLLEKAELVSNVFIGTNSKNDALKVKLPAEAIKNILGFLPLEEKMLISSIFDRHGLKKVLSELQVKIGGETRHLTYEEANTTVLKQDQLFELYKLVNVVKKSDVIVSFKAGEDVDLISLMIKLIKSPEVQALVQMPDDVISKWLATLESDQGSSSSISSNQIRSQDDAENMVVDHQAPAPIDTASVVLDNEFKDEFILHLFEALFGSDPDSSSSISSNKRGREDGEENFPNKIPFTEESRLAGDYDTDISFETL